MVGWFYGDSYYDKKTWCESAFGHDSCRWHAMEFYFVFSTEKDMNWFLLHV